MKYWMSLLGLLLASHSFGQPAGSLDPSFGNGGMTLVSTSNVQDEAHAVILQQDGKILVAGHTLSTVTGKDFILLRFESDGTADASFGNSGLVTTDLQLGSDDVAYAIDLQPDGKIILAGSSDNGSQQDAAVVRYNTDGTIDSTFGTNGRALLDFDSQQLDEIRVVKVHALTGNIVVGGSSIISSSLAKPVVARFLSSGIPDSTFDNEGIRLLWINSLDNQYYNSVEDLTVLPNGKISAIGWRDFPGLSWSSDYWACRINSDGSMDNSFSTDGVNVYNGGFNGHDRAYGMYLKPDNGIVLAGGGYVSNIKYDFTLFEVNADGTVGSLSTGASFSSTTDDIAYSLSMDIVGNYVLAGATGTSSAKSFALARFLPNGSLDNSFGTGGKVTTTFAGYPINECFDATIQPDNKIVAVGNATSDIVVARYLGEDVVAVGDQLQQSVEVYPNPTNGSVYLRIPNSAIGNTYTLSDLRGRELLKGEFQGNQSTLSLDQFAPGIYLLRTNQESEAIKIVKQ